MVPLAVALTATNKRNQASHQSLQLQLNPLPVLVVVTQHHQWHQLHSLQQLLMMMKAVTIMTKTMTMKQEIRNIPGHLYFLT
jgi:hypothetical protein